MTANSSDEEALLPKKAHQDDQQALVELQDTVITHVFGLPLQVVAGVAYCSSSAGMVLMNKAALSLFSFGAPITLLIFQCCVAVLLCNGLSLLNIGRLEPWSLLLVQMWIPVNFIFVSMISTSFLALENLGVPMITVLKNMTNIFVISGDYIFFGKVYGLKVWGTLALMAASALCGSLTDLAFSAEGYFWQLLNSFITASYSLYLRSVMDRVSTLTQDKGRMSELSMVYYNNVLSVPLLLCLAFVLGEFEGLVQQPALTNPLFQIVACITSLIGFSISFASLWFLSTTTATVFNLVGSLNKIPIAILGLLAFDTPWNAQNIASVATGLAAGIVFGFAKF